MLVKTRIDIDGGFFRVTRGRNVLENLLHQQLATLPGEGRNLEHGAFVPEALDEVLHAGLALLCGHHVQLVEHQPARLGVQLGVVFLEFLDNRLGLRHRVHRVIEGRHVHDVQQQPGALQVPQELVPKARPLGGPFDQAGDVGDNKAFLGADAHHTEVGVQRGEGVIGDLGAGIGDCRNKGGLARVGHAQQAHIGQHLELQLQVETLTGVTRGFLARGAVDGALEAQVAKAAITTLGHQDLLSSLQQLVHHFTGVGIADDGAHRHLEDDVLTLGAEHVRPLAVLTALGFKLAGIAEVDQGIEVFVGKRPDMPPTAAIAPVRATELLVFLVPERRAAIAPVASGDLDVGFIYKLHDCIVLETKKHKRPASAGPWVAGAAVPP